MTTTDPASDRQPVVIVFKPKAQRSVQQLDKTQIVRQVMSDRYRRDLLLVDAAARPAGSSMAAFMPASTGFDVDHYDTPIVCTRLTAAERRQLARHPDVELIEDDDDLVGSQGALRRHPAVQGQPRLEAETVPAGVAHVRAPDAWGCSQGRGIRVAVLDTGIDDSHPDLAANVLGGVGLVPGTPSERDDEGHGTFCAGVIGAAADGAGLIGMAPQVSLYAVKVSDRSARFNLRSVIAGLDWCIANRMHVISMSFGMTRPSLALYRMCRRAWDGGAVLVASAGNASSDAGAQFPAAFDHVLGVTAVDRHNLRYPQANVGAGVDLCAPGVDVMSTGLRSGYQTMTGTSAAAPHVAGAAALAWGSHRFAGNAEIVHLLLVPVIVW